MKIFGTLMIALSAPAAAFATTPSGPEAPAAAPVSAPQPVAAQPQPAEPKERLICRRSEQTGQRTASRRVCRTAAQWRAFDR